MAVAAGVPEALAAFESGEADHGALLRTASRRLAGALDDLRTSGSWGLGGADLPDVATRLDLHITDGAGLAHRAGEVGRALARADGRETIRDRAATAYIAAASGRLSPTAAAEYARTGELAPPPPTSKPAGPPSERTSRPPRGPRHRPPAVRPERPDARRCDVAGREPHERRQVGR